MEEYLSETMACEMWNAMDPDGIPWMALPKEEIRDRMRRAAKGFLARMGINTAATLTEFQETWQHTGP